MKDKLEKIRREFEQDSRSERNWEKLRIKYLGRNSELSKILRGLKDLPLEERRRWGREANQLKRAIESSLLAREKQTKDSGIVLDPTLPGIKPVLGELHVITQVERTLREIFYRMGFVMVEGPEVESDYYNFTALNIPEGHPARDMWDTFYVKAKTKAQKSKLLLRTHISPMQVRVMEKFKPPFAVISSGRVFRHEATDARHEHTWDYMEGFVVGENISLANLKYTLNKVLRGFFGEQVKMRMNPAYYPFVEPGADVLMSCIFCSGKGCRVCGSGWLEMLGSGMIHPNVFSTAGYPKGKYTGFAFGLGLSRFAMMKYNINDIRLLYKNDLRYVTDS